MSQFFQIILLLLGKNQLYVIANGMCDFICVSFLLPFSSSVLSNFSTALMCLSNSSKLFPCSRNRCLSSLQWCSKSFDVVQIRLIRSTWLYRMLYLAILDVLNLYKGRSADWFVFFILLCKVCCSWYWTLYP